MSVCMRVCKVLRVDGTCRKVKPALLSICVEGCVCVYVRARVRCWRVRE